MLETLSEIKQWISSVNQEWLWVLQVFVIVLATAITSYVIKRLIVKALQRLHRTTTNWDNILVAAMSRPVTWAVWLTGLSIASHIIYRETQSPIFVATALVRGRICV